MITNLISKTIWEDRYQKDNETFEEQLHRVANYIGSNDEGFVSCIPFIELNFVSDALTPPQ